MNTFSLDFLTNLAYQAEFEVEEGHVTFSYSYEGLVYQCRVDDTSTLATKETRVILFYHIKELSYALIANISDNAFDVYPVVTKGPKNYFLSDYEHDQDTLFALFSESQNSVLRIQGFLDNNIYYPSAEWSIVPDELGDPDCESYVYDVVYTYLLDSDEIFTFKTKHYGDSELIIEKMDKSQKLPFGQCCLNMQLQTISMELPASFQENYKQLFVEQAQFMNGTVSLTVCQQCGKTH